MPLLSAKPWLRLSVAVAPAQRFGEPGGGERRCVPLLDGTFTGRLSGTLLPGGADWQEVAADGTTRIEAHYALRADSGGITDVRSSGVRSAPADVMQALLAGEAVDPTLVYFRTALRFGGTAPEWQAFTRQLFVGVGHRDPDRVRLDIYAVE